jgi:hypothetical protein
MSKWVMRAHFRHLCFKIFPMILGTPPSNWFWSLQSLFENLKVHEDSNSQSGSSLGSVEVHFLTLSHTFRSMKCDSQPSHLARSYPSPCLGREPKAKVATSHVIITVVKHSIFECKTKQMNNFYIFCFTICFNGKLKTPTWAYGSKKFTYLG